MLGKLALATMLGATLGLMPVGSASAHHSANAQFNVTQLAHLTGVLTKFENINPHSYFTFDVKGPGGEVQTWRMECVAPNALRRSGVRIKEDIRIGRTYSITYATARNGGRHGLMLGIVIDGKDRSFAVGQ